MLDRCKSFAGNDLGLAGRPPTNVSPLVVTTYDNSEKL